MARNPVTVCTLDRRTLLVFVQYFPFVIVQDKWEGKKQRQKFLPFPFAFSLTDQDCSSITPEELAVLALELIVSESECHCFPGLLSGRHERIFAHLPATPERIRTGLSEEGK